MYNTTFEQLLEKQQYVHLSPLFSPSNIDKRVHTFHFILMTTMHTTTHVTEQ
jgi:hypothetical protein